MELREFLRRPALHALFLGLLLTAQAAKWCLEAWLRSAGGGGPNAYRAVADTLTWGFSAAGLAVFETFWEKRTNRELEPILSTGMREMEILLGKVAVPAAAALIAGGAVLAGEVGLPRLVPGLPPPRPGAVFLWLVLFLPPFSAGAATLVTAAGLWFRSSGPVILIALVGGGAAIPGLSGWIVAAPRFPPWIGILAWLVFVVAAAGLLRAASGLLRRDPTVGRI